jgi:hypothetical protein
MKVSSLYVLSLDDKSHNQTMNFREIQELQEGVKALCNKYALRLRGENVSVICYKSKEDRGTLEVQGELKKLKDDDNTGMYVFGHSEGAWCDSASGCNAAQLAELIKKLNIRKIRKLCLIACSAAKEEKDKKQDNLPQGNPSYLTRLCEALKTDGLKIPGWTDFVSVCQEGNAIAVYKSQTKQYTEDEKKAYELVTGQPKVSLLGKKVVEKTVKRLVQDGKDLWRAKRKRAYVWEGGKVNVAFDSWHDKDPA